MKSAVAAVLLLTAGCHAAPQAADAGAGSRLERAAVAAGLVVDPASRSIVGAWARDTDRACIVPGDGKESRLGVLVDYGAGQGCAGSGTVKRNGAALDVRLGDCRLTARFDGERIVFPAEVPAACDSLCVGRASLAALTVERQSESVSEALSLRAPSGRTLCGVRQVVDVYVNESRGVTCPADPPLPRRMRRSCRAPIATVSPSPTCPRSSASPRGRCASTRMRG